MAVAFTWAEAASSAGGASGVVKGASDSSSGVTRVLRASPCRSTKEGSSIVLVANSVVRRIRGNERHIDRCGLSLLTRVYKAIIGHAILRTVSMT